MVKVVCISDTHNLHDKMDIPPGDILVHAGDISSRGREEEIVLFGEWFRAQPHLYKILIAGNHDWGFERKPAEAKQWLGDGIIYLQDELATVLVDGREVRIYGSPWQPEFGKWAFNLRRGFRLKEKWDLIPENLDILVTHGPPYYIMDECDHGEHVGCQDLFDAVKRINPKLHVFGHIHEGYGVEVIADTTFVNASSCTVMYTPKNKPIVVEI